MATAGTTQHCYCQIPLVYSIDTVCILTIGYNSSSLCMSSMPVSCKIDAEANFW